MPVSTLTDLQTDSVATKDDTGGSSRTESRTETGTPAVAQTTATTATESGSGAGPAIETQMTTTPGTASATDDGERIPLDELGVTAIVGLLGLLAVRRVGLNGIVAAVHKVQTALAGIVPSGTDDAADGIISIRNEGDFAVTCQIKCQTYDETLFLRSFSLAPGDSASLCEQPDEAFEVVVNVQGRPSTTQTVHEPQNVGDLMVHLWPDSIKFN